MIPVDQPDTDTDTNTPIRQSQRLKDTITKEVNKVTPEEFKKENEITSSHDLSLPNFPRDILSTKMVNSNTSHDNSSSSSHSSVSITNDLSDENENPHKNTGHKSELIPATQPKKKRLRRSYNCGPCKKHKIKCDMKLPCGKCTKYNRINECMENPPNPPTYEQYIVQQQRKKKYLEKRYRNNPNQQQQQQPNGTADSNSFVSSHVLSPVQNFNNISPNQGLSMESQQPGFVPMLVKEATNKPSLTAAPFYSHQPPPQPLSSYQAHVQMNANPLPTNQIIYQYPRIHYDHSLYQQHVIPPPHMAQYQPIPVNHLINIGAIPAQYPGNVYQQPPPYQSHPSLLQQTPQNFHMLPRIPHPAAPLPPPPTHHQHQHQHQQQQQQQQQQHYSPNVALINEQPLSNVNGEKYQRDHKPSAESSSSNTSNKKSI